MNKLKFTDLLAFSTKEIINEISVTELKLFNIRLKKTTKQAFKLHELKNLKKKLAQLKTCLTVHVSKMEKEEEKKLHELAISSKIN